MIIPKDDRNAGGLPLVLSSGKRIMLIRNIYTNKGLLYGAMGYVEVIEFNAESKEPKYIYVKFDDSENWDFFSKFVCSQCNSNRTNSTRIPL